mgnify:FL=1
MSSPQSQAMACLCCRSSSLWSSSRQRRRHLSRWWSTSPSWSGRQWCAWSPGSPRITAQCTWLVTSPWWPSSPSGSSYPSLQGGSWPRGGSQTWGESSVTGPGGRASVWRRSCALTLMVMEMMLRMDSQVLIPFSLNTDYTKENYKED